tara:strand:- start:328 stop:699 length:372 start_codon:yes stop_codon:yes gene_type:complete
MEAISDVTINNFLIPKGMVMMLQTKIAQTTEANFSNTDSFIPERWIRGGCPMHENHNLETIKAFGGGPRFCPGKNLAMHEMTITISAICKQFDFSLAVDPKEIIEQFAFTMYPKHLKVNLQRI